MTGPDRDGSGSDRRLAAVVYADVVGYSRLISTDESAAHEKLVAALDTFHDMASARRGKILNAAGDAILAEFASVTDALDCAVAVQTELAARNQALPAANRFEFRIGLNVGDIIDDRGDIYGNGVNVAARLEALADPGGICISDAVRTAIGQRRSYALDDLGPCRVKNIPEPVHAWALKIPPRTGQASLAALRAEALPFGTLMGIDDDVTRTALDTTREIVIDAVERCGGRSLDTVGGAVDAGFKDARSALDCAIQAREALLRYNGNVGTASQVQYRFGIEVAETFERAVGLSAGLASAGDSSGIRVGASVVDELSGDSNYGFSAVGTDVYAVDVEKPQSSAYALQLESFSIEPPEKPSIVVLPFTCVGAADDEVDALAQGIRLDVQNALVRLSGLLLIATGCAQGMKGASVEEASRQLGVRHVLEGAVRCSGRRIRATIQLTDARSKTTVWSNNYDGHLDEAFDFQDQITERVVTALDVRLASGEQARIWRKCITEPRARDTFYRGLHAYLQMSPTAVDTALHCFERVCELAPESPLGPTLASMCLWFKAVRGWTDDVGQCREMAGRWAERAVRFQDADGQAHTALGNVRLLQGRFDEAMEIAEHAVKIRPGCTQANGFFSNVLLHCGEAERAVAHAREAIRISPIYPPWFVEILAAAYREFGRLDHAIAAAREAVRLTPNSIHGRLILASALVRAGHVEEGQRLAQDVRAREPKFDLKAYVNAQPYRDRATLQKIEDDLLRAGLRGDGLRN